jgi:hypothetical protein
LKTSPIGIGIVRIVKSSQESIFDILLPKQRFMKKYYKRKKETKEIIFFKLVSNDMSKTTSVSKLSLKTKDS